MTTMIERVARALCWKAGMNPDLTLGGDGQNFLWHEYEDAARAAIEAMRDPTEAMVAVCYSDVSAQVWDAMISEALNERNP